MKIAVIGCGVMGTAFARHLAKKNAIILCDRDKEKAAALSKELNGSYFEKVAEAVETADYILLAVKPKDLDAIAREMNDAVGNKILISILAGTPLDLLKHYFPRAIPVRTMPNMGLICGKGVVGLVDETGLSPDIKKGVDSLFEGIGLKLWMSETQIEAITALSGSGIGFIFVIIEAMIDGGVNLGFSSSEAREIVLTTMEGAIALMRATGKHPAELKLQISSPGGTTIAGLKVMEETGVRAGIIKTLTACYEKALNMRKEIA